MESNIPHASEMTADVNAPELVTLYAQDGEAIQVAAEKAESWLRRGFARTPVDLDTLLSEVVALSDALDAPWAAYVAACRACGAIDGAAQETAHEALRLFCEAANKLHLAIHQSFKPAEEA